jgi:hypothetical protein
MQIVYDVIDFPLSAGNDHDIRTFTPEYATVFTVTWSGTEAIWTPSHYIGSSVSEAVSRTRCQ